MAKKCPTYAGSQNGGFANPHKPKIRFCEPYFRGLGIRRYAGSQIFPCILHGDGCGTPMYFVWRRLARVPKIPMYFAWSGWRHKVWKRPSPGKSGQDSQALRGDPRARSVQVHGDSLPLAQAVGIPHAVGAARRRSWMLVPCLVRGTGAGDG